MSMLAVWVDEVGSYISVETGIRDLEKIQIICDTFIKNDCADCILSTCINRFDWPSCCIYTPDIFKISVLLDDMMF